MLTSIYSKQAVFQHAARSALVGGVSLHGLLGVALVVFDHHLALAVGATVARVRLEEGATRAHELPTLDVLARVARGGASARRRAHGEAEGGGAEEGGRKREQHVSARHPSSLLAVWRARVGG